MIRHATPADLETLERLEHASFPDPWASETLQNALRDPAYLVLLSDEAGFLLGWHVGEEAELARLGVLANERGRGLGLALVLQALRDWGMRGVSSVFLEVRASNDVAVRLYERAGFSTIGRRANYYANGEEARVMKFSLSGALIK